VAQVWAAGRIVPYAAQTFRAAAQHPIKIDRLEVGFGRAGGQRGLLHVEAEYRGLEVEQVPLQFGEGRDG
jgi:hypothetical protein